MYVVEAFGLRFGERDALDGERLLGQRPQLLRLDADVAQFLRDADVALQSLHRRHRSLGRGGFVQPAHIFA